MTWGLLAYMALLRSRGRGMLRLGEHEGRGEFGVLPVPRDAAEAGSR